MSSAHADRGSSLVIDAAERFSGRPRTAPLTGTVIPQLKAAFEKYWGVDPSRAEAYMLALLQSTLTGGPEPDPEDYRQPVVVPLFPATTNE